MLLSLLSLVFPCFNGVPKNAATAGCRKGLPNRSAAHDASASEVRELKTRVDFVGIYKDENRDL